MLSKHAVRLSDEQRQFLSTLVRQGHCSVSVLTRAHILLAADGVEIDADHTDEMIAHLVRTSPSTVYRVRKRFAQRGLPAALLANQRRPARRLLPGLDG